MDYVFYRGLLLSRKYRVSESNAIDCSLFNIFGEKVLSGNLVISKRYEVENNISESGNIYFDAKSLEQGLYYININTSDGVFSKKVIIIK